jgi:hypothetical protein
VHSYRAERGFSDAELFRDRAGRGPTVSPFRALEAHADSGR